MPVYLPWDVSSLTLSEQAPCPNELAGGVSMAIRSPYPDVEVPDVSLHELLFADIGDRADRPALIDGSSGRSISFAELATAVERLAAALAERGIGKGDVVGIFSPNIPYYAVAFHGVLRAGATATTINVLYTANEVAEQLRDSGAKHLLPVSPLLERADAAAADSGVTEVVVLDAAPGRTGLADLLATSAPPPSVH